MRETTDVLSCRRRRFPAGLVIRLCLIFAAAGALFFSVCLIPQHGGGMVPSVKDGDLVVTVRAGCSYPSGALCAYRDPEGKLRLGRIAALEGEEVDFSGDGGLLVNGMPVQESAVSRKAPAETDVTFPYVVPKDSFFLLNDCRQEAGDSRRFGAVRREQMRGEAFWLFRRRGF